MSGELAIRLRGVVKRYGEITAVAGLDLDVPVGTCVGLLGPNGAGKSTTMRVILGLVRPSAGTTTVLGRPYRELDRPERRVGALLETFDAHPGRSGRNHLRVLALAGGIPRSRVDEVLALVELSQAGRRRVKGYSLGMRQRLGLAAALLGDPEVLVLDEPTIGLDPRQIAEIRALIRSLAGQHTVILSTHILPEVSMVCDGVIIINRGRIVAQGTESELVQHVFPTARVELHVSGATGDVAQTLRALPAVLGVETLPARDGAQAFVVESPRDRDVRRDLVALVMSRGWILQELHQVGMSLEEVFIRVVAGEESPGEEAVAEPAAFAKEPS